MAETSRLIVAHSAAESEARGEERGGGLALLRPFDVTLSALWRELARLYRSLWGVNTWLALFNEATMLFPYLLAGPLLFDADASRRITLGTLVKLSNAFSKIVDAIGVVSENFAALNAFAAVVVRLREFERQQRGAAQLLLAEGAPRQPGGNAAPAGGCGAPLAAPQCASRRMQEPPP